MRLVSQESVHVCRQSVRSQLAVDGGKSDNLMSECLHGARLMHLNMSCLHTNNALTSQQHRVDDRCVGLRTSHKEEHVSLLVIYSLANLLFCRLCIMVVAITRSLVIVCPTKSL